MLALVRRNRRRYGGYIVHAGVAVALVGIAASTSFQHQRTATLTPGQSVRTDGYDIKYVRATASANPQKISLGAVLSVSKGGHHVTTPAHQLWPVSVPGPDARRSGGSSMAPPRARSGSHSGPSRDLWAVIDPNVTPLQGLISRGDALVGRALLHAESLPASQQTAQLNVIYRCETRSIRELTQRFVTHPWAAQFLIEVSPLVMWLWLGAIVAAFGGLSRSGRCLAQGASRAAPRRPAGGEPAGPRRHPSRPRSPSRRSSASWPRDQPWPT